MGTDIIRRGTKAPAVARFYTFHQNNSGGRFTTPAINVIVEAHSARKADRIAQDHGVYFHGVRHGFDCGCCGDRWYSQWSDDSGDSVPSIYGEPVEEYLNRRKGGWGKREKLPEAMIVYLDGTVTYAIEG